MEEEDRKKLKDFDDVLQLLNDMIRNIDNLIETMDAKRPMQEKNPKDNDGDSKQSG